MRMGAKSDVILFEILVSSFMAEVSFAVETTFDGSTVSWGGSLSWLVGPFLAWLVIFLLGWSFSCLVVFLLC